MIINTVDDIKGLYETSKTDENLFGGLQSELEVNICLLPPIAVLEVSKVLHLASKKYTPENWRRIPVSCHINHAMTHLLKFNAANVNGIQEAELEQLSHAACRLLLALEVYMLYKENGNGVLENKEETEFPL